MFLVINRLFNLVDKRMQNIEAFEEKLPHQSWILKQW